MVDWWIGGLVDWEIGGLVDWWNGGLGFVRLLQRRAKPSVKPSAGKTCSPYKPSAGKNPEIKEIRGGYSL